MPTRPYPAWKFYPVRLPAPEWAAGVLKTFTAARSTIDSSKARGVSSDAALAAIRPGLKKLGFEVEQGKRTKQKIWRPVLFGENGRPVVAYEVEASTTTRRSSSRSRQDVEPPITRTTAISSGRASWSTPTTSSSR